MPTLTTILQNYTQHEESMARSFIAPWISQLAPPGPTTTESREGVMFMILCVSLFAVSFPGISKQVSFLRIPHILFFIGKHFGTGVILATAFIHLLGDAFNSLQKPVVKEQYHNIGKWTGLIILGSLLAIFLIEYISTSYVDHLHAEPSAPPTPALTPPPSRPRSHSRIRSPKSKPKSSNSNGAGTQFAIVPFPKPSTASSSPGINTDAIPRVAVAPSPSSLTPAPIHIRAISERTPLISTQRAQSLSHLPRIHSHLNTHHHHLPTTLVPIDILTNSPRLNRIGGVCVCLLGNGKGQEWEVKRGRSGIRAERETEDEEREEEEAEEEEEFGHEPHMVKIGRKRQIIGIMILQLGIMIHSFVIGMTLAITSGSDFTSLTTAIVFHQLFEGLSLGIRIAALPPPSPPASPLPSPSQPSHSLPTPKPTPQETHSSWLSPSFIWENKLKITLAALFGITTPIGMAIGIVAFSPGKGDTKYEMAHMYLVQGLMSAVSAGMLIYAATVEMIAGDFVFGDVSGHEHTHGHHHAHGLEGEAEEGGHGGESHATMIMKKVLAVCSLFAGVGGMVCVGLFE